jgi:hypothetical protein
MLMACRRFYLHDHFAVSKYERLGTRRDSAFDVFNRGVEALLLLGAVLQICIGGRRFLRLCGRASWQQGQDDALFAASSLRYL